MGACEQWAGCNTFFDGPVDDPLLMRRVSVRAYPGTQTVLAGHDVVIQCRDEGRMRREVYWSREGGLPLPQTASMEDGRLEISGVGRVRRASTGARPLPVRTRMAAEPSPL